MVADAKSASNIIVIIKPNPRLNGTTKHKNSVRQARKTFSHLSMPSTKHASDVRGGCLYARVSTTSLLGRELQQHVFLQLLNAEKACLYQGGTSLGFDAVLSCAESVSVTCFQRVNYGMHV